MKILRALRALRAMRALVRVEWRQLWRHPGRSGLVFLLIAVPVAAIVGGSSLVQVTQPGPEERAAQVLGQADLRIDGVFQWEDLTKVRQALPEDAHVQTLFAGLERVTVSGRRLRARLIALDPATLESTGETPALATGMLRLIEGRAPTNAGEVALSPSLLAGLGRSLGETVTLEYGAARTITGIVVDPEEMDLPVVLRVPAPAEHPGRHSLLVDLSPSDEAATVSALRAAGFTVHTRGEAARGDAAVTAAVFALGSIGLFEAALVISAAFAVGLRRRQVEIGLLGSTGATVRGITSSLLASAALQAVLAGATGTLLAYASVAAVVPWLNEWTNRWSNPLAILPVHIAAAILLGSLAAVLAATLPARSAARLPVRQALSGRRPTTERSRGWLVAGLLMVTASFCLLTLASGDHLLAQGIGVVLGPIFGIIGFGACSPWLLDWSARRAASLPLAWRLAVRDAGRFRERNGAVVTAVLAGMAMSVTIAALVASLEQEFETFPAIYRDDQVVIEGPGAEQAARAIAQQLPTLAAAPMAAVYTHGEPVRGRLDGKESERRAAWIAVGSDELMLALGAEQGLDALRMGRLLVLDAALEFDQVELSAWVGDHAVNGPQAYQNIATGHRMREPAFVLGPGALIALGLETGPPPRASLVPWLVRLSEPVTPELLEQARALAAQSIRTSVDAKLLHSNKTRSIYLVVLVLCALTGILIVTTATALSAAESAPDERALHTLGAAPRVLRSHFAARAGYLALLGSCLAIPAGLLAGFALCSVVNFPLDFVIPWGDCLTIVFGLPTIVYAGAWLFATTRRQNLASL